jgi:hypothetical protein
MRFILLLSLMLSGCCTRYDFGSGVITSARQRLCARHRTPLVTVRGYNMGNDFGCILPTEQYMRFADCYPNAMNVTESLDRDEMHQYPASITYCPKCDVELRRRLR